MLSSTSDFQTIFVCPVDSLVANIGLAGVKVTWLNKVSRLNSLCWRFAECRSGEFPQTPPKQPRNLIYEAGRQFLHSHERLDFTAIISLHIMANTSSTTGFSSITPFNPHFAPEDVQRLQAQLQDARLPENDIVPGAAADYGMPNEWARKVYDHWTTKYSYDTALKRICDMGPHYLASGSAKMWLAKRRCQKRLLK